MNDLPRGRHFIAADRGFATGGGLIARLFAGGFHKLLERIDRGIGEGRLQATLPDGSVRSFGGRNPGPSAQIHLHSWRALIRLITSGSVGWYKAWEMGEWSSADPVAIFEIFARNGTSLGNTARAKGLFRLVNRIAHRVRDNDKEGSRRNIAFHYDLGNDFYSAWLDPGMTYSSAVFAEPIAAEEDLEAAQVRKIEFLLGRLDLQPGDHLLEIGCGWGSLIEVAARDHQARVTGLTLSEEQKVYADQRLDKAGLAERCEIQLTDYRDVEGQFDAIASVEMVEAVGQDYWPSYLATIARMLKPGGRAGLQLISIREDLFDDYAANADFIQTYVFPGGMLISERRFAEIAEGIGLEWRDRSSYRLHDAEPLTRWRQRYERAVDVGRRPADFDER
ncbi:MAG: cyclopropane-fatty-acyl-phospholipid synthase, partial [Alphaproteobacteria bacterium]|nr:cyclopropane-fatty-acyl-phospholipid synthase [Alphaproteobacteria bacterium]